MLCPQCKNEVSEGHLNCPTCGTPLPPVEPSESAEAAQSDAPGSTQVSDQGAPPPPPSSHQDSAPTTESESLAPAAAGTEPVSFAPPPPGQAPVIPAPVQAPMETPATTHPAVDAGQDSPSQPPVSEQVTAPQAPVDEQVAPQAPVDEQVTAPQQPVPEQATAVQPPLGEPVQTPVYPPDQSQIPQQTQPISGQPGAYQQYPVYPQTFDGTVPPQQTQEPKKKSKKLLIGIISGVFAVILIVVGIFAFLEISRSGTYDDAYALMTGKSYHEAQEKFDSLGDYRDSEALSDECQKYIDYNDAKALMDSEDYESALKAFQKLGSFLDSSSCVKECENHISYNEAQDLLDEKEYQAACDMFDDLALDHFLDASDKASECRYALADLILAEGRYYDAYNAFIALGSYQDAADRAAACIIARPGSGETYRDGGFGGQDCPLTINSAGLTRAYYLKIYSGETVVSTIFLNPESSATVSLPVGSYRIKAAYGDNWFGEVDMFGDEGRYYVMIFDSSGSEAMNLEPNYAYTLDLQVSVGGNVNSRSEGRSSF